MSYFLRLIVGDLSATDCKALIAKDLINYMTEQEYIEDEKVILKGKKVQYLHDQLMKLVDDLEDI